MYEIGDSSMHQKIFTQGRGHHGGEGGVWGEGGRGGKIVILRGHVSQFVKLVNLNKL